MTWLVSEYLGKSFILQRVQINVGCDSPSPVRGRNGEIFLLSFDMGNHNIGRNRNWNEHLSEVIFKSKIFSLVPSHYNFDSKMTP